MNYKKADDERIRKNRQALDNSRKSLTRRKNAEENRTYSGKALRDLANGTYAQNSNKVPELRRNNQANNRNRTTRNLREQGYPGSYRNDTIDFDYVLKNDRYFGKKGLSALDTEYKRRHPTSFGPQINGSVDDNDEYYKRFGMSKDQVLEQYEQYKQGKERQFAEKHPILNALKDLPSAPSRAINGAAAMATHKLFPYSDLDKFANDDMFMQETKDVQRRRDYTQDSGKVSNKSKGIAKAISSGGDSLVNIGASSLIGSPMAIADAAAGVGAVIEPAKYVLPILAGTTSYGKSSQETKHELERQGIDDETATDYANAEGVMWGIVDALTAGQGSKAGEVAKQTGKVLPNILKATGKGAALGGGTQAISEAVNKIILGDKGTFNNDVQKYLSQGLTEQEAGVKAFANALGRVGGSAALGGILGGATSLISSGANRLINGNQAPSVNDADDLKNIFVGQNRIGQNETLGIPQNDIAALEAGTALALPEKELPANVIKMPGTNGTIQLPDLSAKSASAAKTAAQTAYKNPRLTIKLEGEKRKAAQTKYNDLSKQLVQKNREIKLQKEIADKTKGKNKTAENKKLKALQSQAKELQISKREIKRQLDGKATPAKEILAQQNKELYDQIFQRKIGILDNINYVAKHAGDTEEANRLAKDIQKSIKEFIETGDVNNTVYSRDTIDKINRLDELANSVDAKYIGHFRDNVLFTDEEGNPSIWNALEGVGENPGITSQIGRFHDENMRTPDTTSAPVQRSHKDLMPENPYFESDSYKTLSDNMKQTETEIDNLENTKAELTKLLEKEDLGAKAKSRETMTPDEYLDATVGDKVRNYTSEGKKIKQSLDNINKRLSELYTRRDEINASQRNLKREASLRQRDNYTFSEPTAATQKEYQGFDMNKATHNDEVQDAINDGSVFYAEMSPLEYLQRSAYDIFHDSTLENTIRSANGYNNIANYAEAMRRGDKFPIPSLTYDSKSGRGQEGRTRALAAYEAGLDKIPVAVVGKPSENPYNTRRVQETPSNIPEADIDAAVAESVASSMDPAHQLAERYASAYRDFDPYADMDNMFDNDSFVESMANDIESGRDLTQYINSLKDMIDDAPDAETEAKMQGLVDELTDLNWDRAYTDGQLTAEEMAALQQELADTGFDWSEPAITNIHNENGHLLSNIKIPEYTMGEDVYFSGSDADIAMAEAQDKAIVDTFKNIITDPEFNALSFKNGNKEVFVSPATNGNGLRMSYTIAGVPTGHHDYSLEQIDDLSSNLRNEAGNGGENIKIQRKSDIAKKTPKEVPTVKPAETNNNQSYWLRVLGDDRFLQEQAAINNTNPETFRQYAMANLGYGDFPGSVPPDNGMPHVNGTIPGDNQKTSQYYNNTMRRTEENAKMSDEEYHERFNENEYKYTPYTDAESEKEGYDFIRRAGGHDAAVEKILNGKFDDETKPFTHVEVDATHILADRAEKEAKELEAQGLDATAKWREADRLHKKLRAELNRSAGAMQANQKWIKKTPRGALDNLVTEANKTIDRKKTKGYTEMVNDLADKVEDAILNNEGKARVDAIKKAFSGKKNKNYKTDQYEQMVLDLVGGKDANKRGSASMAEEAAKLIKKKMGVSTLSLKDERAMLNLFEEAARYEQGSRSYKECIGQAMKIFDANLPSTVGDKFKSLWYDNMLFSIKTMMTRNFGGNVGANAIENLATPLQVGADWLASKVTGQRSRTFSGKAITEGAKGMGKGFKDWALDIKNGVNTTRSGQETMADALSAAKTTFKPNPDNKVLNWINKAGSKYDRVVRKGMEVGDRPIYEAKYAATKAELQAVVDKFGEEGIRKGLPEGDYSLDDVIELIAVNDALESVLQNNTHMKEGMKAAKKFLQETSESMLGTDIASMIMPFIEVSGNMADRYFQYTPFGIVGNILRSYYEKKKFGSVNQRRMTGEAGRNILGGLLTAGGLGLAAKGLISDPYSEDKDEKKRQQQNDYQEYALQTPDQSSQKDFSDIPIFGPKLREAKMEYDAFKEGGIPELLRTMPGAIGSATLDSLFQGLNRVTGGSNKFGNSGVGDNYIGNAWDALRALPPSIMLPSMVRQTAQFLDPNKRDLGDYGTNEYYINSFINNLPVLRQNMLDPKINTAGEPVKQFGDEKGLQRFIDAYISPWKTTHPNANISEAQKYADELKAQTNGEVNPQPQVFNASDLKKVKGYDPEKYTHEDLVNFQNDLYKTNNELANTLISQDWFKKLSPGKQGKYLDMLYASNKDINKENFVRKGLSEAEIEAAKDTLFTGDDKLTKIMRDDDAKHSGMLEYFQNKSGLDILNDKYGTDVGYDTYVKWNTDSDKKAMGGAEAYASNYKAAKELDMDVETYLKKQSEYNGGAAQYAKDRDAAKALGLTVETYTKKQSEYDGGAEAYADNKDNAIKYGFVDKKGKANVEGYDKAVDMFGNNQTKIQAYSTVKKKGYKKNAQLIPELINNNTFSAQDKGKIVMTQHGYQYDDLGKAAKGAYDVGQEAGVWYYYMLKNLADANGDNRLNKSEKSDLKKLMNSDSPYVTQIPDDIYYYLGGAKW